MSSDAEIRRARKRRARRSRARRVASSARTGEASIYRVAQQAGVSIVTVSRVFNDYPHVSAAMRDRVLTAARQVGYQPRLVSKRNLLAVLVGGLEHLAAGDQSSRLMLALMRAAAARGYLIEFLPASTAELATQHLVNGLIEVGLTCDEVNALRDLPPVPKVAINNRQVADDWNVVSIDPTSEIQLAVRHLLDLGHRKMALIHDSSRGWYAEQREAGFRAALREANLEHRHILLSSYRQSPQELARQVMDTGCTGCICMCNQGGLPVLDSLQNELKLRVPEDISLIAMENARVTPYVSPRLTTLAQPLEQVAEAAVEGLLKQAGEAKPERFVHVLKSRLIQRDSVRRLD